MLIKYINKDGEEVEGAYISVTDGATGVVTQLNNGETIHCNPIGRPSHTVSGPTIER